MFSFKLPWWILRCICSKTETNSRYLYVAITGLPECLTSFNLFILMLLHRRDMKHRGKCPTYSSRADLGLLNHMATNWAVLSISTTRDIKAQTKAKRKQLQEMY